MGLLTASKAAMIFDRMESARLSISFITGGAGDMPAAAAAHDRLGQSGVMLTAHGMVALTSAAREQCISTHWQK